MGASSIEPGRSAMRQARKTRLRCRETRFYIAQHAVKRAVAQRIRCQIPARRLQRGNTVAQGEQAEIVEQAAVERGCDDLVLRHGGVGPVVGKNVRVAHARIVRRASQARHPLRRGQEQPARMHRRFARRSGWLTPRAGLAHFPAEAGGAWFRRNWMGLPA